MVHSFHLDKIEAQSAVAQFGSAFFAFGLPLDHD